MYCFRIAHLISPIALNENLMSCQWKVYMRYLEFMRTKGMKKTNTGRWRGVSLHPRRNKESHNRADTKATYDDDDDQKLGVVDISQQE